MHYLLNASIKTKLLAFNTVVHPVFEYVWSPHTKVLVAKLETIHRHAVKWVFKLGRTDSVSECMKLNEIERLDKRRACIMTL